MNQDKMTTDAIKKSVAAAALQYVEAGMTVGIGTGSTANHFIDLLAQSGIAIEGTVASSEASAQRLKQQGIRVLELDEVGLLPLYVDGADESNAQLQLIKGGGGALTREKIVAAASQRFVCIADDSKRVDVLGRFPLPVEVIPMAGRLVAGQLQALGGVVKQRDGFITDNGNIILDVHGLQIDKPVELEARLNQMAGVVTNGLFALRPADMLLLGSAHGVQLYETPASTQQQRQ